jgi:hypothetical protein
MIVINRGIVAILAAHGKPVEGGETLNIAKKADSRKQLPNLAVNKLVNFCYAGH